MPDSNSTLTSANCVLTLTISDVYSSPQTIAGFSADNIFEIGSQAFTQTAMGIDGKLSGGMIFAPTEQTITLQADSASNDVFEAWIAQQKSDVEAYLATGRFELPSISKEYTCKRGFLVSGPPAPSAGTILQPRAYVIQWGSITASDL